MPHTYTCALFHVIFSTKGRCRSISKELQERLWPYIGGIARSNGFVAVSVGGTEDHVHALISLPATLPISKAVQLIKGGSSKWINDNGTRFAWQEGYAGFSVSPSQVQRTIEYIQSQEAHHRRRSFEEEFRLLLRKHGIEFDEKFLFG